MWKIIIVFIAIPIKLMAKNILELPNMEIIPSVVGDTGPDMIQIKGLVEQLKNMDGIISIMKF